MKKDSSEREEGYHLLQVAQKLTKGGGRENHSSTVWLTGKEGREKRRESVHTGYHPLPTELRGKGGRVGTPSTRPC